MNGYSLSRSWFDFCFKNPDLITPTHTAIFFFAVDHCNRLGWKDKFPLPTALAMSAIGVKSYNTYKRCLLELVGFGFIILVQKSTNQYTENIIALSKFDRSIISAPSKIDKANINASSNFDKANDSASSNFDKANDKANAPLYNYTNLKTNKPNKHEKNFFGENSETESQKEKYEYVPPRKHKIISAPIFSEVEYFFHQNMSTKECAQQFFNRYDSVGWEISGSPITNWRALALNWMTNAKKYNKPADSQSSKLQRNMSAVELAKQQLKK